MHLHRFYGKQTCSVVTKNIDTTKAWSSQTHTYFDAKSVIWLTHRDIQIKQPNHHQQQQQQQQQQQHRHDNIRNSDIHTCTLAAGFKAYYPTERTEHATAAWSE